MSSVLSDKGSQLRVDLMSPTLGVPMFAVQNPQGLKSAPPEASHEPTFTERQLDMNAILFRLDLIAGEIHSLRVDLKIRHNIEEERRWPARWRRFVSWWRRMLRQES